MSARSAGILLFRFRGKDLDVFLVHPGGPFWADRDEAAWSIPKGLFEENESPLEAGRREFEEETGFIATGEFIELGELRQSSHKIVHAWALEMNIDAAAIKSNTFSLEWPQGSGIIREYPEVDKGAWFTLDEARRKIHKGQAAFLDRLIELLREGQATCR
jgi:predicted NUDIX family NTP pyrophosphohydrolase